jgi:hypothetical protein
MMSHLRTVGLAVLCALAALAALGSATASATRLCSMEAEACPESKRWGPMHPITGEVGAPFVIATAAGNMNCNKSTIGGTIIAGGGGLGVDAVAGISSLTFAECSIMGTPCTEATAEELSYVAEFAWTSGFNGTMLISPVMKFVCGTKLSCRFTAPNAKLTVIGAEAAEISAANLTLSREGSNCTTSAKLKAIYILSSPGPMFVTQL